MITRFRVDGFKNLIETDLSLGPLTCIAGPNGVGKSNLFDAIRFLSALADEPLIEAAASVRSEKTGRTGDPTSIFHQTGRDSSQDMSFDVDMLVPPEALDDLGQEAVATNTFLRYSLWLGRRDGAIRILKEELNYITKRAAARHLPFPHSLEWRNSVLAAGRRGKHFISTEDDRILLHQDGGGGRARPHLAATLPRTVLSTANAAEGRTAMVARHEMRSWRLLQLEPSALREPDTYAASRSLASNGAHMPATLARLIQWKPEIRPTLLQIDEADVCARVAGRLAELIDGVRSIRLEADDRRELLSVLLTDTSGSEFDARALSDGTLRFLALAILESDPAATGVICLEEPENGINPERVPAMVRLLEDIAVDPTLPADDTNPLRQVVVNTHSPSVVANLNPNYLLVAIPEEVHQGGNRHFRPRFRWLTDTWRAAASPNEPTVPPGKVVQYLSWSTHSRGAPRGLRVIDRGDLQRWLPGLAPRLETSE